PVDVRGLRGGDGASEERREENETRAHAGAKRTRAAPASSARVQKKPGRRGYALPRRGGTRFEKMIRLGRVHRPITCLSARWMTTVEPHPASRKIRIGVTALMLASSSMLLFARLGHYALWDDEAYTALAAQGVWQTGDTTAVLGHNVV